MPWCPQCGTEYREGFERCSDCGTALVAAPPRLDEEVKPGPEWVVAGGYTTDEEAWMAHGLLAEKGIRTAVVDRHVVLYPFPQADTAEVLLLVAPEDAERAEEVLAQAESGADEVSDDDLAAESGPPEP
jgi:hypothetical protein